MLNLFLWPSYKELIIKYVMHLVKLIHINIKCSMLMSGLIFAFGRSCFGQSPTVINLSDCGTSTTLTASAIPNGYTGLIWNNGMTDRRSPLVLQAPIGGK